MEATKGRTNYSLDMPTRNVSLHRVCVLPLALIGLLLTSYLQYERLSTG